ncbi:hypothetical protein VI03_25200 [Burkholderia vietnamiensis]|uniref:hypothetical protein n=1 Tax=Burkholderia vietnamiensis TaxID=60552 RepID=UPI00062106F9|nr:hypothetical protein [Burkholderia vietnamiensis]KKI36077.1 hypothetical protein VI03_25200 [Burkholderia vietnamiensis]MBR8189162.1 hypothetical protein [Burkholderia vietnamiensis]HDR9174369.1 hypothetical protein [Burkholderia vietnamiensis]
MTWAMRPKKGLQRALLALLIVLPLGVRAQTSAADLANQIANDPNSSINNQQLFNGVTKATSNNVNPYSSSTDPNTTSGIQGYFGGGQGYGPGGTSLNQAGTNEVTACNGQSDPTCSAINIVAKGKLGRPQVQITANDPTVSLWRGLSGNAADRINGLLGDYNQCSTTAITTPAQFATYQCGVSKQVADSTCAVTRDITVDQINKYQCTQSFKQIVQYGCNQTLATNCWLPYQGCALGGVVNGSFGGSYFYGQQWAGDAGIMQFGVTQSIPDGPGNYDNSATWNNTLTFTIQNFGQMPYAVLSSVTGGNSFRSVDVNGVTIYSETNDGGRVFRCNSDGATVNTNGGGFSYLCSDSQKTWIPAGSKNVCSGGDHGGCTTYTYPAYWKYKVILNMSNNYGANPGSRTVNMNILPYLHEGVNTVSVNATTGGYGWVGGGSWNVQFLGTMKCDPVCNDTWNDGCASYEARQ